MSAPPPVRLARERGHPLLVALMVWLTLRVPRPVLAALLHPIVLFYYCTAREVRVASRAFFARVLDRPPHPRDTYRQIYAFAATMLDRVRVLGGRVGALRVDVEGAELVIAMLREQGCVLVTAHVGAFDVMRAHARGLEVDVRILMDREQGAVVSRWLEALDPRLAASIIPAGRDGAALVLAVKAALDARALVGIMADRLPPGTRSAVVDVLGQPVALPLTPYLIAAVLKVPVLVGFGVRIGENHYHTRLARLDDEPLPTGRVARAEALAQRFASELSAVARRHPYNWFNFHDYFGDASSGGERTVAHDGAGARHRGAA